MTAHMDCVKAAQMALRESERPIMERAIAAQKAIMEKVKAGKMTREEAKIALKALNEATRKALEQNPARQQACIEMEKCKRILFAAILGELDERQAKAFQDWIDKGPKDPCGPPTRTTP